MTRTQITTVAGKIGLTSGGDGGPATSAGLHFPNGLAVIGTDLYISDFGNGVIRKVDSSGTITTPTLSGLLTGGTISGGPTNLLYHPGCASWQRTCTVLDAP